jgi:uncharacterized protein
MPTLPVKVVPGASCSRITGRYGDGIKVQVAAAPERGKANEAMIDLLAEAFGIKRNQVTIVSGHTQPRKIVQIDIPEADLKAKLAELE